MKNIYAITLLAVLTVGCATAYQPHGLSGGYSERQLSANTFQVRFNGNGYTHWDRARDFALLRSAEVTLQSGNRFFAIVDSAEHAYRLSHTTPVTADTQLNGTVSNSGPGTANIDGTATTTYSGGQTITFVKPSLDNYIVCFSERPVEASLIYDAKLIVRQIKTQYGLK